MTEPDPQDLADWEPPAVIIRSIYDEDGRLNSLAVEWQAAPVAEDVARILAQFLMPKNALPSRMPRDPVLTRNFETLTRNITDSCFAVVNVLGAVDEHDNHICVMSIGHGGAHRCDCGSSFGG